MKRRRSNPLQHNWFRLRSKFGKKRKLYSPLLSRRQVQRLGRFWAVACLTCLFVLNFSGIPFWLEPPAIAQTTNLYIEPLTWDFVGLDSNNVNVGPNSYLNGARVCNVGSSVATNVNVQFVREGATNPYITVRALAEGRSDTVVIPQLQPGSTPPNHHQVAATPANCFDAYFNVVVARNSAAYNTVQKYHIQASASNAGAVRTPINRQLYIEKILSQARNAVIGFSGPTNVFVGDTVTYTLTSSTATAYPQLTISSDFPNAVFQFLNISTSYSNPGGTNSSIYADACGWIADYTTPGYHESSSVCAGPVPDQYTGGKVGNTVVTQYTIKILSTGNGSASNSFNINHLILDFSGGSYHYNSDYGTGLGVAVITVSDRQSDLSIDKSHTGNFSTGNNTYNLAVSNSGPNAAKGPLTVTDTLPDGFSFVSATGTGWTCSANGQTVNCSNPNDLASGATSNIQLQVNVSTSAATNTVNTATVQGSNTDPNPNNNTDSDPTTVVKGVNISLSKDDNQNDPTEETFVAGTTATYRLSVSNSSGFDAAGPLTIVDTLPTGLTYSSVTGTGWTCSATGQNVVCSNPAGLTNGSSSSLNLIVNVQSNVANSVTNTATVTSGSLDTNPADNTATQTNSVTRPGPDLTISKTDNNIIFTQGQPGNYIITVTNGGTAATTGTITVTDTLPASFTYGSAASAANSSGWVCSFSSPTVTCTNSEPLAAGQTSSILLAVTPTTTTGSPFTNNVAVSTPGDTNTTNNTGSDTTTVNTAGGIDLKVVKKLTQINGAAPNPACTTVGTVDTCTAAVNPGNTIQYQISVTNNSGGNGQDANISLTDAVPTGLTNVTWNCSFAGTGPTALGNGSNANTGGSYNSCTGATSEGTSPFSAHLLSGTGNSISIGTISLRKQGGQVVVTVNGTIAASGFAGQLSNTAITSPSTASGADAIPSDNIYTVNTTVPGPDLSLTKTNFSGLVQGIDSIYRLTVTNTSTTRSTAGLITVTDTLPAQLDYVIANSAAGSSGWSCSYSATTRKVTCTNSNVLAPLATSAIDITVKTQATATGSVTNNAIVSAPGDTNTSNNTASVSTNIAVANPDVRISKSAGTLALGQTGIYSLTVDNIGSTVAVAPITVKDTLPVGLTFLSGTGTGWSCSASGQLVTCTYYSNLAAAATAPTLSLNVLVGSQTAASITNNASVDPVPGETVANQTNNATSLISPVGQSADLVITKTLVGNLVAGQNATYQLQVVNNGPSNIPGTVTITDTLPSGLSFVSGTGAGFTCSASGQTVTCTRPTGLTTGSTAIVPLTVAVASGATGSISNTASVSSSLNDPNPGNNTSTTAAIPVSPRQADLGLTKTHAGNFTLGGQGTFTLEVRNYGPATVTGAITLTDTLPSALTLASFVGQDWNCSGINTATASCTYSNPNGLAPNATVAIDLIVDVGAATPIASRTNTATVSSTFPEPAPDPHSNTATDSVTVQAGADLAVTKTSSSTFVVGSTATYSLRLTNNGSGSAAAPITLTDQLPPGLTYAGASSTDSNWVCPATSTSLDITCTYNSSLASGASSGDLLLSVNVANLGASTPANYTNFVTVYSSTQDPNTTNNTTSLTNPRSTGAANRDYGDAPDTYGTDALAGNSSSGTDPIGASHTLSTTVFMGSTATDADTDAQAPLNGTGDDGSGSDDEDGVASFPALTTSTTSYSISVTVTNTSGSSAALLGWIDFNRDGSFQASEGVSVAVATGTTAAPTALTWSNLGSAGMTPGSTYVRLRLTTDATVTTSTPGSQAGPGEVEDYQLTIATAAGSPNVLLVKRITAIRSGGTTTNFTTVFDPSSTLSDTNDEHPNWPAGFLQGGGVTDANPSPADPVRAFKLKPGDEIEYTVYFLNAGTGNAQNLVLCDRVPANQTFVAGSFSGQTPNDGGIAPDQQGIALAIGPTAPAFADNLTYLTNVPDAPDRGEFFAAPLLPSPNRCNVASNPNGLVVVSATRASGPTLIPFATGAGTPANSYGFLRFRARVN